MFTANEVTHMFCGHTRQKETKAVSLRVFYIWSASLKLQYVRIVHLSTLYSKQTGQRVTRVTTDCC